MLKRRIEHFAALVLIGDGLLVCLKPSREARAWKMGPEPFRSVMGVLAKKPQLTRLIGVAQVGVGLWWILRKEEGFQAGGR